MKKMENIIIVLVLIALIALATLFYIYMQNRRGMRGGARGGNARGGKYGGARGSNTHSNNQRVASDITTNDPRDVASNKLYSVKTHNTINFNTHNNDYVLPNTDAQIKQILTKGPPSAVAQLIEILSKHTDDKMSLFAKLGENTTDSEIYKLLNVTSTGVDAESDAVRGKYFARSYYSYTNRLLPNKPAYLDIGGKEGGITLAFAKLIGAKSIDVVEVDEYDTKGINYHIIKKDGMDNTDGASADTTPNIDAAIDKFIANDASYKLPYKDGQFDVISAFMVLHHVENLPSMINEMRRILAPGGKIIIVDHDCWDAYDAMLIDIEHLIYQVGAEDYDIASSWYMRYFAQCQLDVMIGMPRKQLAFMSGPKPTIAANRKFIATYGK